MWALPDEVADRHPSFAALMFHGRDTGAYEIPADRLDAYVAERIERITKNESLQLDLRRTKGDVIRMQCTPLPDGGRMLSYMEVTDIVRQADELRVLRDALENVQDGVLLLDADLHATFMNRKVRQFWEISEQEAAARPYYGSLITRARRAIDPSLSSKELAGFAAKRVAEVKAGDHVRELQTPDNRRLRAHCTNMAGGGRMITYYDVTDLIRNAEQLERLATTDSLTGLYNRRHFLVSLEAEWSRFQRYFRSMSVLMVDIDHFKSINDRYGHAVGDEAIKAVAGACLQGKRKSDIVGRVGGEEFAVLLPETTSSRAKIVAERIRKRIARKRCAPRRAFPDHGQYRCRRGLRQHVRRGCAHGGGRSGAVSGESGGPELLHLVVTATARKVRGGVAHCFWRGRGGGRRCCGECGLPHALWQQRCLVVAS